jgi:hypothetical protein
MAASPLGPLLPVVAQALNLHLPSLRRFVEVLSEADRSVGWLAGIVSSNSRLAGFLPKEVARRRIWGDFAETR